MECRKFWVFIQTFNLTINYNASLSSISSKTFTFPWCDFRIKKSWSLKYRKYMLTLWSGLQYTWRINICLSFKETINMALCENLNRFLSTHRIIFRDKIVCIPSIKFLFRCFARYPNGITHFAQECFPEGFTVDRTVRYEDDGTMTSHHTYELDGSRVISRVTVQCEDFDPEGAIMNDEIVGILSTNSHMFPSGDNAVRQLCHIVSI